jgi:hypothetical protein
MSPGGSEEEKCIWLDTLKANVEHPASSDLIFWPNLVPGFGREKATAEEIVDFAISYKRRILPHDELVRILQAYMHPKTRKDTNQEAFYLIQENLPDFEINHLCLWARNQGLDAEELLTKVKRNEIRSDMSFQQSLAKTYQRDD